MLAASFSGIVSFQQASAIPTFDFIVTPDNPITEILNALFAPASGITVVGGSETFVGRVGDGVNLNTAQSATYTGFNEIANNAGFPNISNPDGIFLTSGIANIAATNNDVSFDHGSVGILAPGTGGDPDLSAILIAASAPSSITNDRNFIQFDFTVAAGMTSVQADFVFGSDEFPDQSVTDVFAFIVDGTNYAFFPDGSLVSFVTGVNAANFEDNNVATGNYNIEYDGISHSMTVVGILDPNLATHTIKIAIADTSDSIFDSGVFIGNLKAGTLDDGGIMNGNGDGQAIGGEIIPINSAALLVAGIGSSAYTVFGIIALVGLGIGILVVKRKHN